ncbi:MAG: proline--tRNA ligase, partial [Acidimicrobiales bacterium]
EVASADPQPVALPAALGAPELVSTPGATTIEAVAGQLGVHPGATLKAFPIVLDGDGGGDGGGDEMALVLVRGDHRVNEIKLQTALGRPFRAARAEEIERRIGPPGYIGPVGADTPVLLDSAITANGAHAAGGVYVAGANRPDAHLRGVAPGRDFSFTTVDVREVVAGDTVNGARLRIEPAIEVGNIFKLGTRYSEPLGADYLDESGRAQPVWMGSYGFGPARAAAAAVEQYADEQGISWPRALAPFDVELVTLGRPGSEERAFSDDLYEQLRATGLEILYDERDAGPGEKFADAELLGCPLRVTVGRKALAAGEVELQIRRGREPRTVPVEGAAQAIAEVWRGLP